VLPHFAHLEALVVLVKYFVMGFEGLNDPARGGIGSYALFCLCVALLQREDREQPREGQRKDGEKEHSSSLSELLVKFFQLWGRDFNSLALGVCVREGGSLFAKSDRAAAPDFQSSLVIEDPLDGTNNIARATYR
jgi:DNA polymerase sigma